MSYCINVCIRIRLIVLLYIYNNTRDGMITVDLSKRVASPRSGFYCWKMLNDFASTKSHFQKQINEIESNFLENRNEIQVFHRIWS